ncbi:MAG: hypothetical protein HQK54_13310 [Oligoflexales bacterium]|nr:hypothetical protein [Oligoflexales bacterium]
MLTTRNDTLLASESISFPTPENPMAKCFAKKVDNQMGNEMEENDCIDIESYAASTKKSRKEIWNQIKTGEIPGKCILGKIFIYPKGEGTNQEQYVFHNDPHINPFTIAPLRTNDINQKKDIADISLNETEANKINRAENNIHKNEETQKTSEMALLIDLLSLSKEENKELMRITSESITSIDEATKKAMSAKDDLLKSKDLQIENFKNIIVQNEKTISKLNQEIEDLNILNKILLKTNNKTTYR